MNVQQFKKACDKEPEEKKFVIIKDKESFCAFNHNGSDSKKILNTLVEDNYMKKEHIQITTNSYLGHVQDTYQLKKAGYKQIE